MKRYRPANGSDFDGFSAHYCDNCLDESKCTISMYASTYEIDDDRYPKEWILKDGAPTCTAFKRPQTDFEKMLENVESDPGQTKIGGWA